MKRIINTLIIFFSIVLFCSCFKPASSKLRVSNYYIETIESVTIGADALNFSDIPKQTQSEYQTIKTGDYSIIATSKSGQKFETTFTVSKHKEGKFTLLIDGIGRASIQDDLK